MNDIEFEFTKIVKILLGVVTDWSYSGGAMVAAIVALIFVLRIKAKKGREVNAKVKDVLDKIK